MNAAYSPCQSHRYKRAFDIPKEAKEHSFLFYFIIESEKNQVW